MAPNFLSLNSEKLDCGLQDIGKSRTWGKSQVLSHRQPCKNSRPRGVSLVCSLKARPSEMRNSLAIGLASKSQGRIVTDGGTILRAFRKSEKNKGLGDDDVKLETRYLSSRSETNDNELFRD